MENPTVPQHWHLTGYSHLPFQTDWQRETRRWGINEGQPLLYSLGRAGVFVNNQVAEEWKVKNPGAVLVPDSCTSSDIKCVLPGKLLSHSVLTWKTGWQFTKHVCGCFIWSSWQPAHMIFFYRWRNWCLERSKVSLKATHLETGKNQGSRNLRLPNSIIKGGQIRIPSPFPHYLESSLN